MLLPTPLLIKIYSPWAVKMLTRFIAVKLVSIFRAPTQHAYCSSQVRPQEGCLDVVHQLPDDSSDEESQSSDEEGELGVQRCHTPEFSDLESEEPFSPAERLSSPFTPAEVRRNTSPLSPASLSRDTTPLSPAPLSPTVSDFLFTPRRVSITYSRKTIKRSRRLRAHADQEAAQARQAAERLESRIKAARTKATAVARSIRRKKLAAEAAAASRKRAERLPRRSRRNRQGRLGDSSDYGVYQLGTLVRSGYRVHKLIDG
jgi:hypothetical protein